MGSDAPTPREVLDFLGRVQGLLEAGRFSSTYKFAMLIALANLSVKLGRDDGRPLLIPMDELAGEIRQIYEPMARPYRFESLKEMDLIRQTTNPNKPLAVLTILKRIIPESSTRHQRIVIVRGIRRTLAKDVLYRLQAVGNDGAKPADQFMYSHPASAAECARLESITLKPGVAACMRQLRGVIVSMVQARWTRWIREHDERLGAEIQLEPFLFGSARIPLTQLAPRLWKLQQGRCFYSGTRLSSPADAHVDHFIPWSWYPCNSPFNLVLASKRANSAKGDRLPCQEVRHRWNDRNDEHCRGALTAPFAEQGLGADPGDHGMILSIADWAYRLGQATQSRMWNCRIAS